MARIKAVLCGASADGGSKSDRDAGIEPDRSHRVMTGDSPLDAGRPNLNYPFLYDAPERVYSREQLLNHVWGTNVYVEDRTVYAYCRLRKARWSTAAMTGWWQTARGQGIVFRPALMPFPPAEHRFPGGECFHSEGV